MIGRSLPFCIRDIVEGKVKLEDVSLIVTFTCVRTNQEFEEFDVSFKIKEDSNTWDLVKLAERYK